MLACSLSDLEIRERRRLVRADLLPQLRSLTETDAGIEVSFTADARDKVDTFIDLEQQCCGFLQFEVTRTDDEVKVNVTAPEEARETLKLIVSAFR